MKHNLDETQERHLEDVKADIRMRLFFAVREAFKSAVRDEGIQAKDLARAIGRDTAFVSRVLSGKSAGITAETAAMFLDALGYHLTVEAKEKAELAISNRDARRRSPSDGPASLRATPRL